MKLQYLGTAAAEGWPGAFCNCENCKKAALLGGKNIRTRSQAIINNDLLIDLPPDTYLHKLAYQIDLSAIRYLLVTHWHMDHFYPQELSVRGAYYSHNMISPDLHIYCSKETKDYFYQVSSWELEESSDKALIWHLLKPFEPQKAGPYTITPLPARHMNGWPSDHPYFYQIEKEAATILYCHDTGQFYEEVWNYLKKNPKKASVISFDCTHGLAPIGNGGHMGLPDAIETKKRLSDLGICTKDTICVLNHFSHNGGILYEELVEKALKEGFQVSYDGMEISL